VGAGAWHQRRRGRRGPVDAGAVRVPAALAAKGA
jgi:hypothetical protein